MPRSSLSFWLRDRTPAPGKRMSRGAMRLALALSVSLISALPSLGADQTAPNFFVPTGWEIRVGGNAHGVGNPERGGADLTLEVLSPQLFQFSPQHFEFIVPRFSAGTTLSLGGKTSFAYAGPAVDFNFTDKIFFEVSFGGAVNNGIIGTIRVPGRAAIGCNLSFRESASLGYRLTSNWSVLASAEHISNANLCSLNRGLTSYGARIAYTF
jgi:lipid A 3-O-deacylase